MAAVDAREFVYWLAYAELETLDHDGYLQAGILGSLVAAMAGAKVAPEDFIPKAKPQKRRKALDTYRTLRQRFGHLRHG